MNIDFHKKLKKKLQENSWGERFKGIQRSLYGFSIFGHLACIGSAHIFVNSIIIETEPDTPVWLAAVISIFLLIVFELIKRSVLYRWSEDFVDPEKRKNSIALLVASILIMVGSFFFTLNGVNRFTDKAYQASQLAEKQRIIVSDSINRIHENRILQLQKRLKITDSLKTQLELRSTDLLLGETGKSNKQVSKLSDKFTNEINSINSEIKNEKETSKKEIEEYMASINKNLLEQTDRAKLNSFYFIIILVSTELIILLGIWFHSFYEWKSVQEGEELINTNENLRNYILWDEALDIMYGTGVRPLGLGQQAPNIKDLTELCRASGIMISEQELRDKFYRMLTALGILETRGSRRYVRQTLKVAKVLLKKQYKQ